MSDLTRVVLSVDGQDWAGWTQLEIVRSLERVAGGFVLGLTERWAGQSEPRPIRRGMACSLAIDGETLITGWIDDVEHAYDATTASLVVRGRDGTGDLFDCAAVHRPYEILGLTLDAIARRLCAPFNISVTAVVDMGRPFGRFAIQPGETVWDAIERGCRQRAVLPMPDGKGGLLLTRAGEAGPSAAPLRLGGPEGNILTGRMTQSAKELFSEYIVMGQQASGSAFDVFTPGSSDRPEQRPMAPSARFSDPSVTRHRPTIVIAEMQGTGMTLAQRAEWERAVAIGKAVRGTYTVQDWKAGGKLWQPNTLVRLTDGLVGLDDAELLIASTTMRLTEAGTITEMEITLRDAYRLIPEGNSGEGGSASALDPWRQFARPGQS
jgi:prophage tail gpP-like protein